MRLLLLFTVLMFVSSTFAKEIKKNNITQQQALKSTIKIYSFQNEPVEPNVPGSIIEQEQSITKSTSTSAVISSGDHYVNAMIDSSRNGFGWLIPGIRSLDRFKGTDAYSVDVDFLVLGYRQYILSNTATGILGATTVDVSAGLANASYYRHVELNQDLYSGTIGARYPGVVALDRPFIAFNQYISGNASTAPAVSSPYLITDYLSYGANGGLWTSSYAMDQGYSHESFAQNRLWSGSVSIVKDGNDKYHYAGVYNNWTIDGETQANDYVILNAESTDPTSGWTIDTSPALIDTFNYMIYPVLNINKNGFGACVGLGHQGPDPDNQFFMSELRIMIKTTTDYGKTWTATREISWAELGIPENVVEADSIKYWDNDSTYHWYNGPVYVAIPNNHALDVIVSDANDIYIGYDLTWGPQAGEDTYYRNWHYCGVHAAISNDGGSNFYDRHIAINNGFFEGDSSSDEAEDNYVFDSEVDLSLDENGALYATWLDRPSVNIEVAEHLRYDRTNQEILLKTDVFTSRSLDGGEEWSWKMNVTNTPSIDEYELKAALHADGSGNGSIYFAYCTIDPSTGVGVGDADAYTYRVNRISVGQGFDYPEVDAITDENPNVVNSFKLDQNYPNPFNPTTTIQYEIAKAGSVELVVFNMLGQRVKTLINRVQNAGTHRVEFIGSDLSSGVYFYQLTVGARTDVRKMVLLK